MLNFEELGVDLGSDSIKIVTLRKIGMQSKITKVKAKASYEVKCKQFSDEYFALLKNSIKSFAKENKIKRMSLNMSLALDNKNTFLEFMTIPSLPKKMLESAVSLENEQKLAAKGVTDVYSSWKTLNSISNKDEEEELSLVTANIKKKILDSLAQFKTINCRINKVILQPIVSESVAIGNVAVINFGVNSTRVSLYNKGKLSQADVIETGSNKILESIKEFSSNYNMGESAEELLSKLELYNEKFSASTPIVNDEEDWYGDIYTEEVISGVDEEYNEENQEMNLLSLHVNGLISELAEEIKKSVRMFELRNSVGLEKVFISGKLSTIKYFKEKIESELDIEVDFLNIADFDDDFDNATYSNAILIAMNTKVKEETNFAKHIKANVDYSSLVILALTLSLSVGGALKISGDKYIEELEKIEASSSEQIITLSSINNEISNIEAEIDSYEKYISKMNSLKSQKKWFSDVLYAIPEKAPLESAISFISVGDESIDIYGYASNYSTIGFFAKSLDEIGETEIVSIEEFKNVDGLSGSQIYSVTLENPDLISKKYLMNQAFHISVKYKSPFLDHE